MSKNPDENINNNRREHSASYGETRNQPSEWENVRDIVDNSYRDKDLNDENSDSRRSKIKEFQEKYGSGQMTTGEFNDFLLSLEESESEALSEDVIRSQLRRVEELESRLEAELTEIEEEQQEISEARQQTEQLNEDVEELRDLTSDLVKGVASESLGKQFQKRKQELEGNLKYWKAASILSILLLMGASGVIYQDITSTSGDGLVFLSKVALIIPISVAVWFSVSNYTQQKRLMNEYEFKKNVALSLMGFREMLSEEVSDENQEMVAEFIMETLNKVYSNPQKNIANTGSDQNQASTAPGSTGVVSSLLNRR